MIDKNLIQKSPVPELSSIDSMVEENIQFNKSAQVKKEE
jgi:hypothetical protein